MQDKIKKLDIDLFPSTIGSDYVKIKKKWINSYKKSYGIFSRPDPETAMKKWDKFFPNGINDYKRSFGLTAIAGEKIVDKLNEIIEKMNE